MGSNPSNIDQFHLDYHSSSHCYRLNASSPLDPSETYQAVTVCTPQRPTCLRTIGLIQKKLALRSRYLVLPHKLYHSHSGTSGTPSAILVYKEEGINLATAMERRAQKGLHYSEADVSYMLECILRGLTVYRRNDMDFDLFTAHGICVNTTTYLFNLVDDYLLTDQPGVKASGVYGTQGTMTAQRLVPVTQKWRKILKDQDDESRSFTTSLLALGLICLCMLQCDMPLTSLFLQRAGKTQLNRKALNRKIDNIADTKLKWKVWLLVSEYPNQREEVYNELYNEFDNVNYPIEILNRKTTLSVDIKPQAPAQSLLFLKNAVVHEASQTRAVSPLLCSRAQSIPHNMPQPPALKVVVSGPVHHQSVPPVTLTQSIFIKKTPSVTTRPSILSPQRQSLQPYQTHQHRRSQSQILQCSHLLPHRNNSPLPHTPQHKLMDSLPVPASKPTAPTAHFTYNPIRTITEPSPSPVFSPLTLQPPSFPQQLDQMFCDQEESIVVGSHSSDEESSLATPADINDLLATSRQRTLSSPSRRTLSFQQDQEEGSNDEPLQIFDKKAIPRISPIVSCSNSVIREESMSLENSFSRQQISVEYVVEEHQRGNYEGYKSNGMRQGYGRFIHKTGEVYEGDWKEDKMHGQGRLYYQVGVLAYEGAWKNDRFHGRGRFLNYAPFPLKSDCDYTDLNKIGNSWVEYEGEFVQDKKSGQGKLTLQNGEEFTGRWSADRAQGKGVFMSRREGCVRGIWHDGRLVSLL